MANSPKSRSRKSGGKNGKDVVKEVPEDDAGSNEEEEDEEGYEVESILDAKWQYDKRVSCSSRVSWPAKIQAFLTSCRANGAIMFAGRDMARKTISGFSRMMLPARKT